jgi:hypothetical protein
MTAKRHRWVHPAAHHYICRDCGLLKINEQAGPGYWRAVYQLPDGTERASDRVPSPCAPGPLTAARLEEYAAILGAR